MITIQLEETKLPRILYEKDGAKRDFLVSHNTLFNFINSNCYEVKNSGKKFEMPVFETPALPPNTVKYMAMPDGKVVLFLREPAKVRDISYHNTKYKNVPFPNLLFLFSFVPVKDGYDLLDKKVFAYKSKVLRETTPLYKFPFSHVMGEGSMCFFYTNNFKDLAQLVSFIHVWATTDFTDHYYSGNGEDKNLFNMSLREVFEKTQNQKTFNNKALKPHEMTFDDLVKRQVKPYFSIN